MNHLRTLMILNFLMVLHSQRPD